MSKAKLENTWKYILVFAVLITLVGGFYLFAGGQQSILGGTSQDITVKGDVRGQSEIVYEDVSCSSNIDCEDYFISLGATLDEVEGNVKCEQRVCVVMSQ